MSDHYNVVIATPGEVFDQHYVWSIIHTTKYLNDHNISWIWLNDYSSHVGEVRQRLVDQARELSYDRLFWIDSDIYWNVEDFMKLYSSRAPIISGCYITTAGAVAAENFNNELISPIDIKYESRVLEVKSVGFGFICMNKGIIESIDNPFSPKNEILNEDVAFCARAKNELHLPILLDTSVKLEHFRTMSLNWNTI